MSEPQVAVIIPALNEAGNIGPLVAELLAVGREMANAALIAPPASADRMPVTEARLLTSPGQSSTTEALLLGSDGRASPTEVRQLTSAGQAPPTAAPTGGALLIIVVDNGSTDATAQEACAAGAHVVSEPRRGYGYACAAGVAAAGDADLLVFIDGDRSSRPAELPGLLAPLLADEADLVLGSRARGHIAPGAMLPHQRFGNWLASRLMSRLYGVTVTDLGPYRAVRRSLLVALDMQEMTFGWPTEMTVKAAKRGARLTEVPVGWYPRQTGRSKVSGTLRGTLLATWYILGVTLRYAWRTPTQEINGG